VRGRGGRDWEGCGPECARERRVGGRNRGCQADLAAPGQPAGPGKGRSGGAWQPAASSGPPNAVDLNLQSSRAARVPHRFASMPPCDSTQLFPSSQPLHRPLSKREARSQNDMPIVCNSSIFTSSKVNAAAWAATRRYSQGSMSSLPVGPSGHSVGHFVTQHRDDARVKKHEPAGAARRKLDHIRAALFGWRCWPFCGVGEVALTQGMCGGHERAAHTAGEGVGNSGGPQAMGKRAVETVQCRICGALSVVWAPPVGTARCCRLSCTVDHPPGDEGDHHRSQRFCMSRRLCVILSKSKF
jgi:hypothetical protein